MDFKTHDCKNLEPFFHKAINVDRYQVEIPSNMPDWLLDKFVDYQIPENLYDDLLWIVRYLLVKYQTIDSKLEKMKAKKAFHKNSNIQGALKPFLIFGDFGESLDWQKEDIDRITISYKGNRKPEIVLDEFDLIRFICESVQFYSKHHPEVLFGFRQLAEENQLYTKISYNRLVTKKAFYKHFREEDAQSIWYFLRSSLPTEISDRKVFCIGAILMYVARIDFPNNPDRFTDTFDVLKGAENFKDWAGVFKMKK